MVVATVRPVGLVGDDGDRIFRRRSIVAVDIK